MKIKYGKEHGVALVVTLVLLLVVLILGITSYQNARLDETMAGNQRAASLALMAAEFGASDFSYEVGPELVLPVRDPTVDESYESYMEAILSAFRDWASSSGNDLLESCPLISIDVASAGVSTLPNSCYTISARGLGGASDLVSVDVDGMVFSGNLDGIAYASGALSSLPDNLVSRRTIRLLVGVILGESLSPLNFVGQLTDYDGIRSQAILEGEEDVDGYINPAISVSSRDEAEKIVRDILKAGPDEDISDLAVFVPSEGCDTSPCEVGVYHSADVVNADGEYEGDYDNCDTTNNNLCNYQGGIASSLGAPILSKPGDFDAFIDAAVTPSSSDVCDTSTDSCTYREPVWLTEAQATSNDSADFINTAVGDQVYFITSQNDSDGYVRPVWDDYNIRESDADLLENPDTESLARLERPYMNLGGFSKSGVLIIDGDVQFSGNPEFEGLIIVLGDYKIDGSGNDPTTGAIISAPYSTRYSAGTDDLAPLRDSGGYLLDASGVKITNETYPDGFGPGTRVVSTSEVLKDSSGNDFDPPIYRSLIVDADGNVTDLEPVYAPVGCSSPSSACPAYTQQDTTAEFSETITNENTESYRKFDPVGVDVNGGGKQPYIYDYSVLERAFSLLSEAARVKFIVGQKRLNGSYEYGVKGWGEVVVPPDI